MERHDHRKSSRLKHRIDDCQEGHRFKEVLAADKQGVPGVHYFLDDPHPAKPWTTEKLTYSSPLGMRQVSVKMRSRYLVILSDVLSQSMKFVKSSLGQLITLP